MHRAACSHIPFLLSLLSSLFISVLSILISLLQKQGRSQVDRSHLAVPSQVARGCSSGRLSFFFLGNNAHSEKFAPRIKKKGSRPGGSPNSLGNDEHSGKALSFVSFSSIFFHFLSFSFILIFFHLFFFHFLSCSFMFFHVLSCSCIFLYFRAFSCIVFHFLSFSFMFL